MSTVSADSADRRFRRWRRKSSFQAARRSLPLTLPLLWSWRSREAATRRSRPRFAKQGKCSAGVARQYSGTLGKVGNCQVSVNCHYAERTLAWPIATRLYLPAAWASDSARRKAAKVPEEVVFQTKPELAFDLLDQ